MFRQTQNISQAPARAANGRQLNRLVACAAIALCPALMLLYLKHVIMYQSGYNIVARSLGRIDAVGDPHRLSSFTFLEKLSFRENDADAAGRYLNAGKLAKIAFAVPIVVAIAWWARRRDARTPDGRTPTRPARPWRRSSCLAMLAPLACAVLITALAWLPVMRSTRYHDGIAWALAGNLFGSERIDTSEFDRLSPAQLRDRHRQINGAPQPSARPAYWAGARDCDVLLFVLETAPARCLPADGDPSDCTTLLRLRNRSLVGDMHHSVYPCTSRAVFSILSSWYPMSLASSHPVRTSGARFPGLMRSLRHVGYVTALYASDACTRENDDSTYAMLGIQRRWCPPSTAAAKSSASSTPAAAQVQRDRSALDALRHDMAQWQQNHQRFAAICLPQIGRLLGPTSPAARQPPLLPAGGP